jgi:hypothetical protein
MLPLRVMLALIVEVAPARIAGGLEVMGGVGRSHPFDLDSSNPCRNDDVD